MAIIVLHILKEGRPVWFYVLASAAFVISQVIWFLAGRVICKVRCIKNSWVSLLFIVPSQGTNQKIDGSFIATVLETGSVVALYLGWKSITEGPSNEEHFPYQTNLLLTFASFFVQIHGTTMTNLHISGQTHLRFLSFQCHNFHSFSWIQSTDLSCSCIIVLT